MLYPIQQLRSEDFPELLQEIPDRPKALAYRGTLPPPETIYLCIVGSRAMSPYGRRHTHNIVSGLAGYPIAIASGLALGVDTEAHAALSRMHVLNRVMYARPEEEGGEVNVILI